jgi:hypothetical protein
LGTWAAKAQVSMGVAREPFYVSWPAQRLIPQHIQTWFIKLQKIYTNWFAAVGDFLLFSIAWWSNVIPHTGYA